MLLDTEPAEINLSMNSHMNETPVLLLMLYEINCGLIICVSLIMDMYLYRVESSIRFYIWVEIYFLWECWSLQFYWRTQWSVKNA